MGMKKLLLALVALLGIGVAAGTSLADHGYYGYRGDSRHGQWDCHHHHRGYYPRPVYGCGVYGPVYGHGAIYGSPGVFYQGRNVSFGIGF
jgi:hypothetical protein